MDLQIADDFPNAGEGQAVMQASGYRSDGNHTCRLISPITQTKKTEKKKLRLLLSLDTSQTPSPAGDKNHHQTAKQKKKRQIGQEGPAGALPAFAKKSGRAS